MAGSATAADLAFGFTLLAVIALLLGFFFVFLIEGVIQLTEWFVERFFPEENE